MPRPAAPAGDRLIAGHSAGPTARGSTRSPDGTPIAWFRSGAGPPLVLVHGTTADHTTFRAVEPILRERFTCVAIDRRGRGASGDTLPYSIAREFEDVAAVVDAAAASTGRRVDVLGHSYGGRCALGAALLTSSVRRVIVYEGAPAPVDERTSALGDRLLAELRRLIDAGRPDEALRSFLRTIVGQTPAELAAFEASPVWDARVAAAHTILRELEAALHAPEASLEALARVGVPVLLIAGSESGPMFRAGIDALAARLPDVHVVVIPGQRHAAHHGAAARFSREVTAFLDA